MVLITYWGLQQKIFVADFVCLIVRMSNVSEV
jgi:hypothetical protein